VAVLAATEGRQPQDPDDPRRGNLSKMADRGQIRGGLVDGPLAWTMPFPRVSRIKGIKSEVAGYADVLIAPDIEAGNVLAKAITYFAQGKDGRCGGRGPLPVDRVLTLRYPRGQAGGSGTRGDFGPRERVSIGPVESWWIDWTSHRQLGINSRIVLFTGRFGSGKTEVAINYALGWPSRRG